LRSETLSYSTAIARGEASRHPGVCFAAYRLLGCRDLARIDFRLDAAGQPVFLECNPLPGLNPESSDIVILTRATLSYDNLVQGILLDAMQRYGMAIG